MTIRGWIASLYSSYYARTRNGAWTAASMLFLACALSYTRAQAGVTVGADAEYPVRDAQELLAAARNPDPAAQKTVKAVLERADPAMIEDLLRLGLGTSRRDRVQRILQRMGRKAIPTLMSRLDDESTGFLAGGTLYQVVDEGDHERIPALIDCARTKERVKNYCATALVKISSPKASAHVPALAACVKDGGRDFSPYCAAALGRIGAKAAPATDALIAALADADPVLRARAAASLGAIGRGAVKAAPALRRSLKDSSPEVSREAGAALRRIGA